MAAPSDGCSHCWVHPVLGAQRAVGHGPVVGDEVGAVVPATTASPAIAGQDSSSEAGLLGLRLGPVLRASTGLVDDQRAGGTVQRMGTRASWHPAPEPPACFVVEAWPLLALKALSFLAKSQRRPASTISGSCDPSRSLLAAVEARCDGGCRRGGEEEEAEGGLAQAGELRSLAVCRARGRHDRCRCLRLPRRQRVDRQ
jgi:hypothetical protein